MTNASEVVVQWPVEIALYYERNQRTWWAFYRNAETGDQLTPAWFGPSRDQVLVHRPNTPRV